MNEAILNKLVELGYVDDKKECSVKYAIEHPFSQPSPENILFPVCLDALIAECEKRDLMVSVYQVDLHIFYGNTGKPLFEAPYSRQAIIEAFCKVTGVEC